MKKIVLAVALMVSLGAFVSCGKDNAKSKVKKENVLKAQERDSKPVESPKISFDKEIYDFGTVEEGEVIETSFVVTNTGKSDLVILDAKATCGCTVPTWTKEPVKPGEKTELKVRFDTNGRPNKQIKTVTLTTNTEKGIETVKVSGMVKPKNK